MITASSPETFLHKTALQLTHRAPAITTNPLAAPAAPVWPAAPALCLRPGRKQGSRPCLGPCPEEAGEPVSANTSSS